MLPLWHSMRVPLQLVLYVCCGGMYQFPLCARAQVLEAVGKEELAAEARQALDQLCEQPTI